ncbi:hypothetical protein Q5752_005372 [Cryptotrichosporon argae]
MLRPRLPVRPPIFSRSLTVQHSPSSLPRRASSRPFLRSLASTGHLPPAQRGHLPRLHSRRIHTSSLRAFVFKLHDIGEGITEVEIVRWHVGAGDRVDEFDNLCEVQSDKSVVDITSPCAGTVNRLAADVGGTVRVGEVLCEIRADDEVSEDSGVGQARGDGQADAATTDGATESPHRVKDMEDRAVDTSSASAEPTGTGGRTKGLETATSSSVDQTEGGETADAVPEPAAEPTGAVRPAPSEHDTTVLFAGEGAVVPPAPRAASAAPAAVPARSDRPPDKPAQVRASPAVRALAGRLGVDLGTVEGSGDEGRVKRTDVERAGRSVPAPTTSDGETTTVRMGKTRRVMWRAMSAQAQVPHFGYSHTLDLTPLLPYLRARAPDTLPYRAADLQAAFPLRETGEQQGGEKITLLSVVVKTLLLAAREHPVMRARADGEALLVAGTPVIGIAVSDPKYGLLTPSFSLSSALPLSAISAALAALRSAPAAPTPPAHMAVSSVGGLGEATGANPVLPPGTTAICVLGRARWALEPVAGTESAGRSVWDWRPDEVLASGVAARLRVPVGWSGDHRILEGAELIAFTETWKRLVEDPARWIGQ